jgi:hypothetical protein
MSLDNLRRFIELCVGPKGAWFGRLSKQGQDDYFKAHKSKKHRLSKHLELTVPTNRVTLSDLKRQCNTIKREQEYYGAVYFRFVNYKGKVQFAEAENHIHDQIVKLMNIPRGAKYRCGQISSVDINKFKTTGDLYRWIDKNWGYEKTKGCGLEHYRE